MAALTNPGVLYSSGGAGQPRVVLLSFPKVTAGDTFDLSTLTSIAAFVTVTDAAFAAISSRNATFAASTIAGTTVTIVGTGVAADAGILFVVGE